jgi:hypothetical protein
MAFLWPDLFNDVVEVFFLEPQELSDLPGPELTGPYQSVESGFRDLQDLCNFLDSE